MPGDRARYLDDGRIELLGRDSVTINSGGEKIFAEEVERGDRRAPARLRRRRGRAGPRNAGAARSSPSCSCAEGRAPTDDELVDDCATHVARYKLPKAFVRADKVVRSPRARPTTAGPRTWR